MREWLGGMVAGHVVESDRSGTKFWLPEERYKTLSTKDPSPLLFLRMLFGLSHELDAVFDCFKLDGPRGTRQGGHKT